ncbi:hypothetical protein [Flavobacterium foetidum]|uniref:hypothetical protein n=1 Tax=Flavobacterium foetidum TaxID=2026681 RepID=UPI001FC91028|nr:hypothetical protein [Flavobacterium foetidum]
MTDFSTIKKLFHITEPNGFTKDEIQIIKDIFGDFQKFLSIIIQNWVKSKI